MDDHSRRPRGLGHVLVDRLAMAVALAAAGYFLIAEHHRRELASDYRKTMFTRRMDACVDLLAAARDARDEFTLVFTRPDSGRPAVEERVWETRFLRLRERVAGAPLEGPGETWDSYGARDALDAVKKVDVIRRRNAVYLSQDEEAAVDGFLAAMLDALETAIPPPGLPSDPAAAAAAAKRAQEAHDAFHRKIGSRLPREPVL
jgi:hypothetical protein